MEHIYLAMEESPERVAEQLAPFLGMEVSHDAGRVYLSRSARGRDGVVGGEVYLNYIADPDPEAEEESLIDRFPIVFDVGYTQRDANVQLEEATQIFAELNSKTSFPMALVHGHDFLIAASSPRTGLVWLPEKTTPYEQDRALWLPFLPEDN